MLTENVQTPLQIKIINMAKYCLSHENHKYKCRKFIKEKNTAIRRGKNLDLKFSYLNAPLNTHGFRCEKLKQKPIAL